MELLVERCGGLDVHKKTVAACVRVPGPDGARRCEVRTFATFTPELEAMADWLVAEGVTTVAMESTGAYWWPVWHVLEEREGLELLLVNARHAHNVPGRKTDVADAAWLAQLAECGLLRASFVPEPGFRRAAGPDPLPATAGRDPHPGVPPPDQGARRRRHQAGLGGVQDPDGVGAADDRSPVRRRA